MLCLPAIYPYRFFIESGGLASYGFVRVEQFHQTANYADRILVSNGTQTGPRIGMQTGPLSGVGQGCPGSEQEGPARSGATATSPAQRSAGGACLPTGASRGDGQARCLKRQDSLPVSTVSQ